MGASGYSFLARAGVDVMGRAVTSGLGRVSWEVLVAAVAGPRCLRGSPNPPFPPLLPHVVIRVVMCSAKVSGTGLFFSWGEGVSVFHHSG